MPTDTERQLELGRELADCLIGADDPAATGGERHQFWDRAQLAARTYVELDEARLAASSDDDEEDDDAEWPDYPCPQDPEGVHHIGCGCDF